MSSDFSEVDPGGKRRRGGGDRCWGWQPERVWCLRTGAVLGAPTSSGLTDEQRHEGRDANKRRREEGNGKGDEEIREPALDENGMSRGRGSTDRGRHD